MSGLKEALEYWVWSRFHSLKQWRSLLSPPLHTFGTLSIEPLMEIILPSDRFIPVREEAML